MKFPEGPKLIPLMPKVFEDPGATPDAIGGGLASYQVLRGAKAVFPKDSEGPQLTEIIDGLSKTVAVVEVARDMAVSWTKPEDLAFDPDRPFDGLGTDRRPGGLFVAAFPDSHIEALSPEAPPNVMKAMVTPRESDGVEE